MKKILSIALTIMLMILMPSCKDKEDEVDPCRIAANGAISMASMFEYRNVYLDGIKLTWSMGKITSIALIDANDDIYNQRIYTTSRATPSWPTSSARATYSTPRWYATVS